MEKPKEGTYWTTRLKQLNKICPVCHKSVPIMICGRFHLACRKKLAAERKTLNKDKRNLAKLKW